MLLVSPFALEVTGWLRGEGYKSRACMLKAPPISTLFKSSITIAITVAASS